MMVTIKALVKAWEGANTPSDDGDGDDDDDDDGDDVVVGEG